MGIEGLKVDEINSKVAQYWSVIVIDETKSTQSDLANDFAPGKVLFAEFQSAGRGRLDRKFEVPPRKGLTFSFAISPSSDFNDYGWIPLITGLAVVRAINNYVGKDLISLKWPNDLLIGDKKLGGILSEKVKPGVVVGVGINVWQSAAELPISNAISLNMAESEKNLDRTDLAIAILNEIGLCLSDINSYKNEYRSACSTIGNQVAATLPSGEIIEDLAIGISADGSLLLRTREITVGDTVHLR